MNILVIGNGFDIAHNLPTTYSDFMEFIIRIEHTMKWHGERNKFEDTHMKEYNAEEYIKDYIKKAFDERIISTSENSTNNNPLIQEMYDSITNNVWFEYLKNIYQEKKIRGINWIDFESEISYVIENLDRHQGNIYMPIDPPKIFEDYKTQKFMMFYDNITEINSINKEYRQTYKDLIDNTYKDLRRFVRCMEIYFLECVESVDVHIESQDIKSINIDKVLSFNYTHIYEKVYGINEKQDIHYIHGETTQNAIIGNNMVLGIDEYRDNYERSLHTNYNIYKKFTQRVINETGFKHREWIKSMKQNYYIMKKYPTMDGKEINIVYIFGHSLDITDKEIIKDLIDFDGVKTIVFYHDKQQQTQQIANLVKMLGQEKFLEKINSVPPTIEFREQQIMINK